MHSVLLRRGKDGRGRCKSRVARVCHNVMFVLLLVVTNAISLP